MKIHNQSANRHISPPSMKIMEMNSLDSAGMSKDASDGSKIKVMEPVYTSLFDVPDDNSPRKLINKTKHKKLNKSLGRYISQTHRLNHPHTISHSRERSQTKDQSKDQASIANFPNIHRTFVINQNEMFNQVPKSNKKLKKLKKNISGSLASSRRLKSTKRSVV